MQWVPAGCQLGIMGKKIIKKDYGLSENVMPMEAGNYLSPDSRALAYTWLSLLEKRKDFMPIS